MALAPGPPDRKPRLQPQRDPVRDRDGRRRGIRRPAADARRAPAARVMGIRSRARAAPPAARADRRIAVRRALDTRGADAHRRRRAALGAGAGRGLGRAVAEGLAAMGASVVRASRNAPELDDVAKAIKRAGGKALAQTADIADERQVQELVLATERWVGPATILVNNAGMGDPMVPLGRSNAGRWLARVGSRAGATYLATRA